MSTETQNISRAVLLSAGVCVAALLSGAVAWKSISLASDDSDDLAKAMGIDAEKYFVTTMVKERIRLDENGRPLDCPNYLLKAKEDHFFTLRDIHNIPYCKALSYKLNLKESVEVCSVFGYLKSEANYNAKIETALSGYCN